MKYSNAASWLRAAFLQMIIALQMLPMKKLYTRDRKIWHPTAKFSENTFQLN